MTNVLLRRGKGWMEAARARAKFGCDKEKHTLGKACSSTAALRSTAAEWRRRAELCSRMTWSATSPGALRASESTLLRHSVTRTPIAVRDSPDGIHYIDTACGSAADECAAGSSRDEELPTIVLAHGFGAGLALFGLQVDALAAEFPRVLAFDWPGFALSTRAHRFEGSTSAEAEHYFLSRMSRWLRHTGVAESRGGFVLVGHSMGGYLSAVHAMTAPSGFAGTAAHLGTPAPKGQWPPAGGSLSSAARRPEPSKFSKSSAFFSESSPSSPSSSSSSPSSSSKSSSPSSRPCSESSEISGGSDEISPSFSRGLRGVVLLSPFGVAPAPPPQGGPVTRARSLGIVRRIEARELSGQALLRAVGPLGERLVRAGRRSLSAGFAGAETGLSESAAHDAVSRYAFHANVQPGSWESGESAFAHLTRRISFPRDPLLPRLADAGAAPAAARVPWSFLYGDRDWMDPRAGARAVKAIQARGGRASIDIVPKAGHNLMVDNASATNQIVIHRIKEFLKK